MIMTDVDVHTWHHITSLLTEIVSALRLLYRAHLAAKTLHYTNSMADAFVQGNQRSGSSLSCMPGLKAMASVHLS